MLLLSMCVVTRVIKDSLVMCLSSIDFCIKDANVVTHANNSFNARATSTRIVSGDRQQMTYTLLT